MGAVNIDNTGSGASVTLSSDGTDLLLNGSPIGGGGGGASPITISNKTSAYTVVSGDLGTIINCTSGTFTVALDAAATLGAGFNCWIWNTSTSGVGAAITIDPNGSETIDGRSTLVLQRGEGLQIVCDGTNWQTGDKKTMRGYAENLFPTVTRPTASGGSAVAIVDGAVASGSFSLAIGGSTTASSTSSTAIGRNSSSQGAQAVTGAGAMALGGSRASGTDSFAAAVANNTSSYGATGVNSVAVGRNAKATDTRSVAISWSTASAAGAVCIGSGAGSATNQGAVAIGGYTNSGALASGAESLALGNSSVASLNGKMARANGQFANAGDAQTGTFVLRIATTNATPTVLISNLSTPDTTNQVILPNNSAYAFSGIIVARQQASGGTASAAWKIEGLIRREANAASTTLVASTVTAIDNTPGWTLALSADTTNGGLKIEATGAAATNIRWVATVQTSEVTYA